MCENVPLMHHDSNGYLVLETQREAAPKNETLTLLHNAVLYHFLN